MVIVLKTAIDQTHMLRNQPKYGYRSPPHITVK